MRCFLPRLDHINIIAVNIEATHNIVSAFGTHVAPATIQKLDSNDNAIGDLEFELGQI